MICAQAPQMQSSDKARAPDCPDDIFKAAVRADRLTEPIKLQRSFGITVEVGRLFGQWESIVNWPRCDRILFSIRSGDRSAACSNERGLPQETAFELFGESVGQAVISGLRGMKILEIESIRNAGL